MKKKCRFCSKLFNDFDALETHTKQQHPTSRPSDDQIDEVARQALWEFLTSDGIDKGLLAKAKQANAYRSTEARREQTEGAREATLVMMARELAENKTQFKEYIRLAIPSSPLLQIEAAKK